MGFFAWAFLILCLLGSLAGTFLPALPGTALILVGALVHKFVFPNILNTYVIIGVGVLALLGWIIDFVALLVGAKLGKASRRGLLGATIGAVAGLFFPPFGLIAGPVFGAMAGELTAQRTLKDSLQSGLGAGAGTATSLVLRIVMNLVAVIAIVCDLFIN